MLPSTETLNGPDQVWLNDTTCIALANGRWTCLAVWMDRWPRLIVGWHLAETIEEELKTTAFRRAVLGRQPRLGLVVHSDRGGQLLAKHSGSYWSVMRVSAEHEPGG